MSKSCSSLEEAEKTVAYYREHRGIEACIERSGDQFLVYRAEDRKTLKSIQYSPANLEAILFSDQSRASGAGD
jgi:hypothetical protein